MKKYLLYIALVISGAIIGGITSATYILGKVLSDYAQIMGTNSISDLGECAFKIYSAGDYESAVIALNCYSDRLESYKNLFAHENRYYIIMISIWGWLTAVYFCCMNQKGKQIWRSRNIKKQSDSSEKNGI